MTVYAQPNFPDRHFQLVSFKSVHVKCSIPLVYCAYWLFKSLYNNYYKCILLPLKGLFTLVDKNFIIVCIFSSDLLKNPLIVPVKILKGHAISHDLGVLDCVFHPSQPWVFSCGADTTIRLFTWLFTWCKGWISGRGHCIRYTKYTTSLQGLHMEEE